MAHSDVLRQCSTSVAFEAKPHVIDEWNVASN